MGPTFTISTGNPLISSHSNMSLPVSHQTQEKSDVFNNTKENDIHNTASRSCYV